MAFRSFSARILAPTLLLLLAAALLPSTPSRAQADAPLYDFEADTQGFMSEQPGSQVTVTREAARVKSGTGALEWAYDSKVNPQLQLVLDQGLKKGATTLEFWASASSTAAYQLLIIEGDGTMYFLMMSLPEGKWQRYRVPLTDFTAGTNKDENGQLDLDQVRVVMFQDTSQYYGPAGSLDARKFWLDGLTLSNATVPQRRRTEPVGDRLEVTHDDFNAEAIGWEAATANTTSLEKDGDRRFVRCKYRRDAGGGYPLLSDHIDPRYSVGDTLRVVARAARGTRLTVEMREWNGDFNGPDYRATVELPAGGEWKTSTVPFKDFKLKEGVKDSNEKLDVGDVWLLTLRDESGGAEDNTLEIDHLSALLPK